MLKKNIVLNYAQILSNKILYTLYFFLLFKQRRKRPLDTPRGMIESREREGEREKER